MQPMLLVDGRVGATGLEITGWPLISVPTSHSKKPGTMFGLLVLKPPEIGGTIAVNSVRRPVYPLRLTRCTKMQAGQGTEIGWAKSESDSDVFSGERFHTVVVEL